LLREANGVVPATVGNAIEPSVPSFTCDDAAHRLTAVQNNVGERIEYALDLMGNRTAETARNLGQMRIHDTAERSSILDL